MNYKRLLKKITHKDYMGGVFPYYGYRVNVTSGTECMDVHIEDGKRTLAEFDFTFEIPRSVAFHNMGKRTSDSILGNLNTLYKANIPVYHE
ncbi:hypothetical protein [Dysgonomonas termitidis]|uniref:Uncharacterized protein n=1 Tax=Dysgonomonas termitidis TaxID=1516126 RepID=A0ABV9L1N0_9BACT